MILTLWREMREVAVGLWNDSQEQRATANRIGSQWLSFSVLRWVHSRGEFQNGIVPERERVTERALVKILWGLGEAEFYRTGIDMVASSLMSRYLAKEFQFGA
jgi:hypothetical protein